jgi:putative colanic acid biosynthesis acetyltransferase WcaF
MSQIVSSDTIQDLAKFRMPPGFRGRSAIVVQLWWIVQALLFRTSPQFMYAWRNWLLRLFGADIGRDVLIRPTVRVVYPWKLTIADNSWVGDFVELYSLERIRVGRNAVISQHTYLCTGSHDYRSVAFDITAKPITIQDEAWLAAAVFVHPGVTIGRGAVVSARSVVVNDIEPLTVNAGSPAVAVGVRNIRSGGSS